MCTLNIRFDSTDDYPLIVAANRDEFYDRPSVLPAVISENPLIFAPRDQEAGGTWFGVNEWGLIVAITNVWLGKPSEHNQMVVPTRSRGLLTLNALCCNNIEETQHEIRKRISEETYQYFNLLVASTTSSIIFTYTGELKEYILGAGDFTIQNSPYQPSIVNSDELPAFPGSENSSKAETELWFRQIRKFLSRHPEICKHGEKFGTRSAQIVALGKRSPGIAEPLFPDKFWYADGPPCETEFVNYSYQLQSITGTESSPVEKG